MPQDYDLFCPSIVEACSNHRSGHCYRRYVYEQGHFCSREMKLLILLIGQSVGLIVFSVIEMNLSILCACLPSMSPLLRLTISSSLRSETHDSPAYYNASSTISTREGISVKSSLKSQRKWSRVVGNMRRIMFLGRSNANSANSKEDMQLPIIHRSYTVNTITGVSETQSDVDKRSNWQESIATQELDIGRLGEPKNRAETTTTALRH